MRYSTISTVGAFTDLSDSSSDYLRIDPNRCTGGSDAPLRTTVEQIPGADGVFVFPAFDDAQIITLGGDLIVTSAGDESGYFTALDTLFTSLKTALDLMKATPDTLTHSGGSLSVAKYAPIDTSYQGALMGVTFGLVVVT